MKFKSIYSKILPVLLLLALSLFFQCSGSRYLSVQDIKSDQSIRLYLRSGEVQEGIVLEKSNSGLKVVMDDDHQTHTFRFIDIRRMERNKKYYDYQAYEISAAEIEKYKRNRNTWGFAVGGAAIGGLTGLAIGLPIWLANDDPPPFFAAGIGAVVGSIYFATHGIKKDREAAVRQVRYLREREYQLVDQKKEEEERLKQLREEKERLQKQLELKRRKKNDGSGN